MLRKISMALSMIALMGALGCELFPRSFVRQPTKMAFSRPDFAAAGIDYTPVGTAKQVAQSKRRRAE